jgi:hypothetical protein
VEHFHALLVEESEPLDVIEVQAKFLVQLFEGLEEGGVVVAGEGELAADGRVAVEFEGDLVRTPGAPTWSSGIGKVR